MEKNENPYATFDYENLPLVKVTLTRNKATDENFNSYLEEAHSIYKKGKYAMLFEPNGTLYLEGKFRIRQGKKIKEEYDLIKNTVIGLAIIVPLTMQRVVLNGIFLLSPYPSPYKFCKNEEEALHFLNQLIETENITTHL
jgi:hypothetical protein